MKFPTLSNFLYFLYYFTLLFRRYSHLWALACSRIWIQRCLSLATFCQFIIPSARRSDSTPSIHLIFGRPTPLRPSGSFRNNIKGALVLSMRAKCPAHLNRWTFTTATMSGSPKSRFSSKLYSRLVPRRRRNQR